MANCESPTTVPPIATTPANAASGRAASRSASRDECTARLRRSSDSDALDLDLPSRIGEGPDDQRARRLPVAQDRAASLAGRGNVALVRQDGGDLDEIVQRHSGSLHLRFEILPSEAALLDDVVGERAIHPLADLPANIEHARSARDFDRLCVGGYGKGRVGGVEIAALHRSLLGCLPPNLASETYSAPSRRDNMGRG